MAIKQQKLTLVSSTMISPYVKHLAFSYEDNNIMNFIPGQFITIYIQHEGKVLRRSYSIATIPKQSNLIEFAAGYVKNGLATNLLFNLKIGETIVVSGAFGRLILRDEAPKNIFMLATSTGITPFRSMIPAINKKMQQNPELNITIMLGVRNKQEILYHNDFAQIKNKNFKFIACLSRDDITKNYQKKGYVQDNLTKLKPNPQTDIVYLCGNPNMIDDTFAYLTNLGFEVNNVRREKYISK